MPPSHRPSAVFVPGKQPELFFVSGAFAMRTTHMRVRCFEIAFFVTFCAGMDSCGCLALCVYRWFRDMTRTASLS